MSFYRIKYYRLRNKKYQHLYFPRDRVPRSDNKAKSIVEKIAADEKSAQNLARCRRTIRDIILCNLFECFCTFTFSAEKADRYNFKECQKKLSQFFNNYRKRYAPNFKYLIVPEFHKDGGIHFHGMVRGIRPEDFEVPEMILKRDRMTDNLTLVPNTKGYVRWKNYNLGFFSCSRVKNYEACAKYVAKYITKDLVYMPLGRRMYMCSEGLCRPDLLFDGDNIPLLGIPDYENKFVKILDSEDGFGLVPDWYGEAGAETYEDEIEEIALKESDILYPRLTGKQLSLYRERETFPD